MVGLLLVKFALLASHPHEGQTLGPAVYVQLIVKKQQISLRSPD
ncbi:MAG: hypothetical protein K0R67_1990 [Paenibacillus sp.]|nr:hypothetical protein [Paenibacillus sp.]